MSEERDRLRAAGYDPEAMTHAEVVEAIGLGLVPGVCPVQIPQPEFTADPARKPSRLSRLAPGAIAALLGSLVGADPSFESYERDRGRGSE